MPTLPSSQTSYGFTLGLICLQGETLLISPCGILGEKSLTDDCEIWAFVFPENYLERAVHLLIYY